MNALTWDLTMMMPVSAPMRAAATRPRIALDEPQAQELVAEARDHRSDRGHAAHGQVELPDGQRTQLREADDGERGGVPQQRVDREQRVEEPGGGDRECQEHAQRDERAHEQRIRADARSP